MIAMSVEERPKERARMSFVETVSGELAMRKVMYVRNNFKVQVRFTYAF
jgi:hypothetical protein